METELDLIVSKLLKLHSHGLYCIIRTDLDNHYIMEISSDQLGPEIVDRVLGSINTNPNPSFISVGLEQCHFELVRGKNRDEKEGEWEQKLEEAQTQAQTQAQLVVRFPSGSRAFSFSVFSQEAKRILDGLI